MPMGGSWSGETRSQRPGVRRGEELGAGILFHGSPGYPEAVGSSLCSPAQDGGCGWNLTGVPNLPTPPALGQTQGQTRRVAGRAVLLLLCWQLLQLSLSPGGSPLCPPGPWQSPAGSRCSGTSF